MYKSFTFIIGSKCYEIEILQWAYSQSEFIIIEEFLFYNMK